MASAATQIARSNMSSDRPDSLSSKEREGSADDKMVRGTEREPEKIAVLAYSYWEAREGKNGSPEEDWFRAEMELYGQPPAET